MTQTSSSGYYQRVGAYYDEDAPQFENRYWANSTLQKIRNSFREETECFEFNEVLEVGFGPGVDLLYFAEKYPAKHFFGIDISSGMYDHAQKQLLEKHCGNVRLALGSVEDIATVFPHETFDLIYVYFGALNTVENLDKAAAHLISVLKPNGKIVVTFINKWYLAGMFLPLLKGRFNIAFQRLKTVWGGYSPTRHLNSKCYTPQNIRRSFSQLTEIKKRGYSIFYPAWYQDSLRKKLGKFSDFLWQVDNVANKTILWSKGEYTLFVFSKKS